MLNNEWKISGIEKGRTKRKKNKRKEETKKHGRSYDDRTIFRNAVSIWLVSLWSLYSINATRSRLTAIALRYQKREEKEEKKEERERKTIEDRPIDTFGQTRTKNPCSFFSSCLRRYTVRNQCYNCSKLEEEAWSVRKVPRNERSVSLIRQFDMSSIDFANFTTRC